MFKWLSSRRCKNNVCVRPIGEVIPWDAGMTLKALEPVTFAFPKALLGGDEIIAAVIQCDDDAQFGFDDENDRIIVRLQTGMKLSISRSSQAIVLPEFPGDTAARRIEICAGK